MHRIDFKNKEEENILIEENKLMGNILKTHYNHYNEWGYLEYEGEEISNFIEKAIKAIKYKMNCVAKIYDFENINSASLYITSKYPKYAESSQKLTDWRDDVWHFYDDLLEKIELNQIECPKTIKEIIDLMPVFIP